MAKEPATKATPLAKSPAILAPADGDPRFVNVVAAFARDPKLAPIAKALGESKKTGGRKFGSDGLKVKGKLFAMMDSKGDLEAHEFVKGAR